MNDEEYFLNNYTGANANVAFCARYPGALGNSLRVSVCSSEATFDSWLFAPYFDSAPNTSNFVVAKTNNSTLKDEMHIIVVDEDGVITGTANTVLERFSNLSKCSDARGDDGSSIYYKEVLYRTSKWIHWLGHAPGSNAANAWGQTVAAASATGTPLHSPVIANYPNTINN